MKQILGAGESIECSQSTTDRSSTAGAGLKSGLRSAAGSHSTRGIAGWLLDRVRHRPRPQSRLTVLERIALAPRHSLALIEAEGRKLLVATSQDGAPVFYALDAAGRQGNASRPRKPAGRLSW
jgi:hypothetical protein